jgi:phytoene synthase
MTGRQQQRGDGLAAAYRHCWQIAASHYENFTLGSWLLPRPLRRHIAAIYAFARTADDIADEGNVEPALRVARLQEWEQQLEQCYRGDVSDPIFVALHDTVQRFDIPIDPFRRLLQAFRSDAEFQPFATFEALRDYCHCSADPVGHLILYLFGYRDAQRQQLADQICTGLQLANFWQDVAIDAAKGRVYVPDEDLTRFGCSATELMHGARTPALRALMAFEVARARSMLTSGLELATLVNRRLAHEVSLFAWGGLAVLRAIEAVDYDVFTRRPTVSKWTQAGLVFRALVGRTLREPQGERTRSHSERSESQMDQQPFVLRPSKHVSRRIAEHAALSSTRAAYAYCQNITRRSSSNFYYAFRLLSPERRDALFAVYAFCRFVDDIADDAGRSDPAGLLARWRDELGRVYDGTPTHPISCALADAVQRFPLAQQHFLDLIRGVEMDLTQRRYPTFDGLYEYCYLVASTVGLLCIEIFGHQHDSARDYAVDLGIAFQLTNILRDVMEDGRRGRIYLPLEDLRRFDCTEAELLSSHYSPRLGALMAFECGRARAYYLRGRGALAPEDRSSLAAAEAMRLIYERLLDRIEARHFDVFGPKVTLPRYQKLTLALAAWGRSQLAVLTS